MQNLIYLDNNATTCLADEVREAMAPYQGALYANPSSPCTFAQGVSAAVSRAREQVAGLIGAEPGELVFTSGGTESNNAAILAALKWAPEKKHIVTTAVEHPSVRKTCEVWGEEGFRVSFVPVDSEGRLDLDALEDALCDATALVSVMTANNETGVLLPVAEVATRAKARGIPVHTDAVQAAGKVLLSVRDTRADLLSMSAHKLHGPKGIGALYVRGGRRIQPLLVGGDHERGQRAGTLNVAGIVGMGAAAEVVGRDLEGVGARVRALRDDLQRMLVEGLPEARVAGGEAERLPNTLAVLIPGIEVETVLALLDMRGICCSSGSACSVGAAEPSHVLAAMGLTGAATQAALRFSLSRYTTGEEVESAARVVVQVARELREAEKA